MPTPENPAGDYRYSYSGSDAKPVAYFPGRSDKVTPIESMHTISWSVHDAKGPARSLGYRGIKGFARSTRTIAGSMILTVIEDHPLASIMDMMAEIYLDPAVRFGGWSVDWNELGVGSGLDSTTFNRRLATTLPPFNVLVQYVAEGAKWARAPNTPTTFHIPGAAFLLIGVEFQDEGIVTSTSDAASEMTYSFWARDCKTLSQQQFEKVLNGPYPPDDIGRKDAELYLILRQEAEQRAAQYKLQVGEISGGTSVSANRIGP